MSTSGLSHLLIEPSIAPREVPPIPSVYLKHPLRISALHRRKVGSQQQRTKFITLLDWHVIEWALVFHTRFMFIEQRVNFSCEALNVGIGVISHVAVVAIVLTVVSIWVTRTLSPVRLPRPPHANTIAHIQIGYTLILISRHPISLTACPYAIVVVHLCHVKVGNGGEDWATIQATLHNSHTIHTHQQYTQTWQNMRRIQQIQSLEYKVVVLVTRALGIVGLGRRTGCPGSCHLGLRGPGNRRGVAGV